MTAQDHIDIKTNHRNPAVRGVAKHFANAHLTAELRAVSEKCTETALFMLEALPDTPELTVGLRKLLEAKDCFVRAAIDELDAEQGADS